MPRYGSVGGPAEPLGNLQVAMGEGKVEQAGLLRTWLDDARRVPVYLVDHPKFFGERKGLYGFPDDGWRFVFFSRAVIEAVRHLGLKPDIIHCHDWHTGMVPAYLKLLHPADLGKTACVFTIHNLMYQGIWGREVMAYSGLPWSAFSPQGVEFYGNLNCLKAGIV